MPLVVNAHQNRGTGTSQGIGDTLTRSMANVYAKTVDGLIGQGTTTRIRQHRHHLSFANLFRNVLHLVCTLLDLVGVPARRGVHVVVLPHRFVVLLPTQGGSFSQSQGSIQRMTRTRFDPLSLPRNKSRLGSPQQFISEKVTKSAPSAMARAMDSVSLQPLCILNCGAPCNKPEPRSSTRGIPLACASWASSFRSYTFRKSIMEKLELCTRTKALVCASISFS